jgi:hypothetical protein
MKVSILIDQPSIDLRVFDFLRAELYSKQKDVFIEYHTDPNALCGADKKILFSYMPSHLDHNLDDFDLVFFSNGDETTTVATECLLEHLDHPHAYLLANAWLHQGHALYHKVISCNNDFLITRQYWTNAYFPQYHSHQVAAPTKVTDLFFINGANRSWRHHVIEEIKKQIPTLLCHSSLSDVIHETDDAFWESDQDSAFREYVNTRYSIKRNVSSRYYENSVSFPVPSGVLGLPQGECIIPPGYFITNHYYQYRCVIFPEATWKNNEASPTEKIAKCFFAKTLPWPVGGSKINQIYNALGFRTAWNLLPETLRDYDDENDHIKRHSKMSIAMAWLAEHSEILKSQACQQIIDQNYITFLCNDIDARSVARLQKLLLDQ